MYLCYGLAMVASALGLFGVAKVGLQSKAGVEQVEQEQKPWAQQRWEEGWKLRAGCKAKCMGDEACLKTCVKPWVFLKEKCDAAEPIWECHRQCGHDHACHEQCPLPKCSKAAAKVKETLECHGKCGTDRACHHGCGRPFSEFQAICKSFDHVSACHKACARGDSACHANCPKMSWTAHYEHRGYHHDHDHGHDHHHGHMHGKFDHLQFFLAMHHKCDAAMPIWECHQQCGHDHACQKQCPLPECAKAAAKVKEAIECHGQCASDRACHHTCGAPMREMKEMCGTLDKASACHKACAAGDHECHHNCPKVWHQHEHGRWHHEHGLHGNHSYHEHEHHHGHHSHHGHEYGDHEHEHHHDHHGHHDHEFMREDIVV